VIWAESLLAFFPTRLVTMAALFRRCSPSPHPCSGCSVTFLLSLLVDNHNLVIIRLCRTKVVNFIRLYSRGLGQLPGSPSRPPKNTSLVILQISQGGLLWQHGNYNRFARRPEEGPLYTLQLTQQCVQGDLNTRHCLFDQFLLLTFVIPRTRQP
jgi:hypothetical protein